MLSAAVPGSESGAVLSSAKLQAVLAVVLALGLHGALLAALGRETGGGATASGEGGSDLVSLVPASTDLVALVAQWESPPDPVPAPALAATPKPPEAAPVEPAVSPAAPLAPTPMAPVAVPAEVAPAVTPEASAQSAEPPPPRPADPPQARAAKQPEPAPRPAARAQGSGGGNAAGQDGADQAGTASPGLSDALTAWGAEIRARVERKKSFPRSARGLTGSVAVALTVARDGRLVDAAIVTSSGNEAFDGAALKAIRAAGRFPRGPADLDGAHRFSFNLRFIP